MAEFFDEWEVVLDGLSQFLKAERTMVVRDAKPECDPSTARGKVIVFGLRFYVSIQPSWIVISEIELRLSW